MKNALKPHNKAMFYVSKIIEIMELNYIIVNKMYINFK